MSDQVPRRRLAAILAADVVGYSRLMGADEEGTLAALKARRQDILQPLLAKHHGRIVKVMGDGALVEFASAVSAVQCAIDLQQAMAAANSDLPNDQHILLRVGVNLGDVMVEGSDLYGDGVNIAARLEAIADPGGIVLSSTAYDYVRNKVKATFDDLGAQILKNIAEPIRAYRVVRIGAVAASAPKPATDRPFIAVLPFANMSGDPEQTYFSDGITEDIITEISRFRELFVIARNSSFQYRDKSTDVRRIGRELDVQYVVEGSVRRAGDRVRVTAQLIHAVTGNHLWAERYDRDLADVFTLQEELAHAIAATIGGRVEAAGRERTMRLSPAGLTAYDLVLRAKALNLKFTRGDMIQARDLALRAIEIDPTYARAHAYYASSCFMLWMAYWTAERERMFQDACRHAEHAVALDDSDSVTQCMLGFMKVFARDYEEARVHIEKALAVNPNNSEARIFYAVYLTATGQSDAAIEQLDVGKRLNPFDYAWGPWVRGGACFTAGRYDEAIEVLNQIPEPANEIRGWLAASYAHAGRLTEARAALAEFLRIAKEDMAVYPGNRLKDWEPYWHGAMQYRDQRDFDHLFDALRKAGFPD
jgi:TolB-like protein/Flp pilus assembly protein TadD